MGTGLSRRNLSAHGSKATQAETHRGPGYYSPPWEGTRHVVLTSSTSCAKRPSHPPQRSVPLRTHPEGTSSPPSSYTHQSITEFPTSSTGQAALYRTAQSS